MIEQSRKPALFYLLALEAWAEGAAAFARPSTTKKDSILREMLQFDRDDAGCVADVMQFVRRRLKQGHVRGICTRVDGKGGA